MRKVYKYILLSLILIIPIFMLSSCKNTSDTPIGIIQDKYGNNEYKIRFSEKNLDEAISNLTYTANSIPKLPTPYKVGYIFEGWYLDSEYTIPYSDNILLLYMSDVTLYAKFSKEEFTIDGIYDIDYEAYLDETTLVLGDTTIEDGGFLDFSKMLIDDEICIEKTNDKLLLKLKYETIYTMSMFSSIHKVFDISVSKNMSTDIKINNNIDSLSDTIKATFVDITNMDLSETLYLDITTYAFSNGYVDDSKRMKSETKYRINFNIKSVIGFRTGYYNYDSNLEKGYYLVKTYQYQSNLSETMLSTFNPVYSYIYSDGKKHYKLIKPIAPYFGMSMMVDGKSLEVDDTVYFQRLSSFIPADICYDIDLGEYKDKLGEGYNKSSYFPSDFNAGYYHNFIYEYDNESRKFYYEIDMDNKLYDAFVLRCAATGFMEVAMGMNYLSQVLYIDYSSMIKLSSCDYVKLTGDSYQYQDEIAYHAGDVTTLSNAQVYNSIEEGYSILDLYNFFYTKDRLYSFKIETTPTSQANINRIEESRDTISYFNRKFNIYDYDYKNNDLYADVLRCQNYGYVSLRDNKKIKQGESCNLGDQINILDLFIKYCSDSISFNNASYKIYEMDLDYNVLYSNEINKDLSFKFDNSIAIIFEYENDKEKCYTKVELVKKEDPIFTNDTPDGEYYINDVIDFPNINYSWYDLKNVNYFYEYYATDYKTINPINVYMYSYQNGEFIYNHIDMLNTNITLKSKHMILCYILENNYGEKYYLKYDIYANDYGKAEIINSDDEILYTTDISYKYNEETDEMKRNSISYEYSFKIDSLNYNDYLNRKYYISSNDIKNELIISKIDISTPFANYEYDNISVDEMWEMIKDLDYARINILYENNEGDTLNISYLYNFNINGDSSLNIFKYKAYYVNETYQLIRPKLYGSNNEFIAYVNVSLGSMTNDNGVYNFKLNKIGTQTIKLYFNWYGIRTVLYQNVNVYDGTTKINIKYITDTEHPFSDGSYEKNFYYYPNDICKLIDKTSFMKTNDILFGFLLNENDFATSALRPSYQITNLKEYNSINITLYALFDEGITINANSNNYISTRTFYMQNSGENYGLYVIDLSLFTYKEMDGYLIKGYTGGIIGSGIKPVDGVITTDDSSIYDSYDIEMIYEKKIKLSFEIDKNYSNSYYQSIIINDNNIYSVFYTPIPKLGYKFDGWHIKGDITRTIIDIENFKFDESCTLIAMFSEVLE